MRKIIALFIVTFAFGINVNAQDMGKPSSMQNAVVVNNETNTKEIAVKEFELISKVIKLDEESKNKIVTLLLLRAEDLKGDLSEERRKILYEAYGKKIILSLSDGQLKTLKENKELYKNLTEFNSK